ncbi:MAG: hypothetical protein A3K11_00100 [Nitrospirae bacterium RIFCSPLOWO2_12_FULL_63_8]|nr:MAG: hypothetical protein A3K11_00100 [Nitrospirae bacterium RIFCSPLOWO2_12_FULL_63_8]
MKEQLERLIALQEADLRLEELAERKRRIPEMVEAARQPLQAAQALRESAKQAFETTGKERKSCEQELAAQEQVISKLQDRTTKGEIKTNREYQAHLLEVELTKKKRGEIEEQILILMDAVDTKKKELAQAEAVAKEADQRFNAEKTALESSVGALDEELAGLRQKREALMATVEPSLLRSYEKLKSSKKGQAMAGVNKDGSCMSCRLQVQPQVVAEVKRATSILTCSYCNRILYWAGDPVQIVPIPEKPAELLEIEEAAETTE